MSPQGRIKLISQPLYLTRQSVELPFSIRQPISKGLGLFLYTDKYAVWLKKLLPKGNPTHAEVRAFKELYQQVIAHLSPYASCLQDLFLLASVMYVDQFGYRQLLHFALWLEHALGTIRFKNQAIRSETISAYLCNSPLNLLDVIVGAFRPEQVIDYLKDGQYATYDEKEAEQIEAGKRVQGRYKKQVLTYCGRENQDSL